MSAKIIKKFHNRKVFSRLQAKDKDAFIEIYDANVNDIFRFIYFKVGNKEEAEDLSSQVFLKTWYHIQTNTLENVKTLRALLYKVARNIIIDYYREQNTKKAISLDDKEDFLNIPSEENEAKQIKRLDEERDLILIKSKLPELKDEYREVIILRFVNDLSIEEIADIMRKSKGAVRVLLHRALQALKSLVEEEQGSLAD